MSSTTCPKTQEELREALKDCARKITKGEKTYAAALGFITCIYLESYLGEHERELEDPHNFANKLTGVLVRAFDDLKHPTSGSAAEKFVERYSQLDKKFHAGTKPALFSYVENGWSEDTDVLFVTKIIIQNIFGQDEFGKNFDFGVLEAEGKVLQLHFQRFLNRIWEDAGASAKELAAGGMPCSGIFGRTRFSVYRADGYIVFKFSDFREDDLCNFQFRTPIGLREGFNARLVSCKIELSLALQMLDEVIDNFDLNDFRPHAVCVPAAN